MDEHDLLVTPGGDARARLQQCPLCGYRFDKPAEVCHACPFHERCAVDSCPHCGYQFVTRSSVVSFFKRVLGRAPGS